MSAELAVVYAALILEDDSIPITSDRIRKLLEAAKVTVEDFWVDLFEEYFKRNSIAGLLKDTALGGTIAGYAAPKGSPAENSLAVEEMKVEHKEEEVVLELAGGFDDLFG
jgi:large subunit ribosomal protein LP1